MYGRNTPRQGGAVSEGRNTPQPPVVNAPATSVWGVAAASTAFGGPGGTGYYRGNNGQTQGTGVGGGGVASMMGGGAAGVQGISQQAPQSDLHVPVKKWIKKWEGSKYTPQMIGLTPASVNIPRTKADADALRLYRWVQTDEIVGERTNQDNEGNEGNDAVENLEAAANGAKGRGGGGEGEGGDDGGEEEEGGDEDGGAASEAEEGSGDGNNDMDEDGESTNAGGGDEGGD